MKRVSATKARDELSDILKNISEGDRIVIERYGSPVAVIISPFELKELDTSKEKLSLLSNREDSGETNKSHLLYVNNWKEKASGEDSGISLHLSFESAEKFREEFWDSNTASVMGPSKEIYALPVENLVYNEVRDSGGFLVISEDALSENGIHRIIPK